MSAEINSSGNQNYITHNSKTNIPGYDNQLDHTGSIITDTPFEGKEIREKPADEKNCCAVDNIQINKSTDKKVEESKKYVEENIKDQNFSKNIKRTGEYKNIL